MDNRNDGALERNYFHPKKIEFDNTHCLRKVSNDE